MPTSGDNSRLGDRLITFHQYFIRHFLSPLYLNTAIRTHRRAESAAYTGVLVDRRHGMMPFFIYLVGREREDLLRTYAHAKAAALAEIGPES